MMRIDDRLLVFRSGAIALKVLKSPLSTAAQSNARPSALAAHYLDQVHGGDDLPPREFREFVQNSGDPGGPAVPGGAYWQSEWVY